jgi:hypothetical protein
MDAEALHGDSDRPAPRSDEPVPTITDDGLVLGRTVLAKMERDGFGRPLLAVNGAEDHVLALLSIAYGKPADPKVLDNIHRAATAWRDGDTCLALIHLALAGLSPLSEHDASSRLALADRLLADGFSPRELTKACGLDIPYDVTKGGYNADQPRIPAGNPDGGQWTTDGRGEAALPQSSPAPGIVLADYRVLKEPPSDEKIVIPSDGVPIFGGNPPTLLVAPRHADYRQVYAAGQVIASLSYSEQIRRGYAALHHGGTYDFQRDPIRQENQPAYANASNYAVGVYMAGAGYTLDRRLVSPKCMLSSTPPITAAANK